MVLIYSFTSVYTLKQAFFLLSRDTKIFLYYARPNLEHFFWKRGEICQKKVLNSDQLAVLPREQSKTSHTSG